MKIKLDQKLQTSRRPRVICDNVKTCMKPAVQLGVEIAVISRDHGQEVGVLNWVTNFRKVGAYAAVYVPI
jgi:hypothetical protein